jgi:hypothetical protein
MVASQTQVGMFMNSSGGGIFEHGQNARPA